MFTLNEFGKQTKFDFNLISDWNRELIYLYESGKDLPNGMKGIADRNVFIIDRTGTIRDIWRSENGSLPNNEEILDKLRKL